jgi:hypothetical protein
MAGEYIAEVENVVAMVLHLRKTTDASPLIDMVADTSPGLTLVEF